MARSRFQFLKFAHDLWDPSHRFETSWLLPPWALFGIRAALSLYAFTTIFTIIIYEALGPSYGTLAARRSFSYFTILSYWGLAFYFLTSAIHTLSYTLHGGTPLLNRLPGPLQALHSLFYTSILTYPPIITLTFFLAIHCGSCLSTTWPAYVNVSHHILNTFFSLFELLIPRTNPPLWMHLFWLEIGLAMYLGVAFITHDEQGWWTYEFLGGSGGKTAGYVIGIAVAMAVVFAIVWGLVWVRKWVTERKWGCEGRFYGGRGLGNGDVELDVQRAWEK